MSEERRELTRDKGDWLRKLLPDEWIRAGLAELKRAEQAYAAGNARGGAAGVKRAAGMALNGALLVEPDESWGRAYVEHLEALAKDARVPEAVRSACRTVLEAKAPAGEVVVLRTPRAHEGVLEAARDVIAHAWVVVKRHEPPPG
jgi:HEPN domain-containing protein